MKTLFRPIKLFNESGEYLWKRKVKLRKQNMKTI